MIDDTKDKSQSWPLTETTATPIDHTQPHPDQNPGHTPRGLIQLSNGALTNCPVENGRFTKGDIPPTWVVRNLFAADITVFVMFAIGPVLCAFGLLMRDDLNDDDYDFSCEHNYIALASELWDETLFNVLPGSGRYHHDCRLLYRWSKLLIAAGSLSIWRPMMQILPIYNPTQMTIRYSPNGTMANLHSPSRVLVLRTFFSAVPAVLCFVSALILGTSRLITGPETLEEWYKPMYLVCLGLICLSFVLSLHQAMSTGVAAWYLRGYKKIPWGFRPGE